MSSFTIAPNLIDILFKPYTQVKYVKSDDVNVKKTLWPHLMDGVQLSQGCKDTIRTQFNFYH